MITPPPETRDPRTVLAALAGLMAAGALLAFVYVYAGSGVTGPAAASVARAAGAPQAPATATRERLATATATRPASARPTSRATASVVDSATVAATATFTTTVAITATMAAGGAPATADAVRLIQPPPPFFSFRRPFGIRNAIEASRYYPYGTTGRGEYLLHHGVDIGNPMGAEVVAVGDGEVVYAGDDVQRLWGPQADFYGNVVVLRQAATLAGQPLYSLYGHLSEVKVAAGEAVRAGEVIGLVGMAGIALGPHLHLEFRVGEPDYESTQNAELFLEPLSGRGTIIGRVATADGAPVPRAQVSLFRAEGGAESYVAETTTYPGRHVNATAELGENFLFADIPAGAYRVAATGGGLRTSVAVTVTDGAAVFLDIKR